MKNYLSAIWRALIGLLRSLGARLGWRRERLFRSVVVDDVPEALKDYEVYLVGSQESPWLAVLRCPCGCGVSLLLNLLPEDRPCWSVKQTQNKIVSLHPSVWRQVGCHSHFFLRDGRIQWCIDRQVSNDRKAS